MDGEIHEFELMEPASPEALVPDYALWPWFAAAAAILLLAIAVWLLLRKRQPAGPHLATLRKTAWRDAKAALETLTPNSGRDTAVRCSLVLRKYLAAAANDPALFETHEEFISRHDSLLALKPEARAAAESGFARLASMKYAPEIPAADPAQIITDAKALLETLHHGFAA